MAYLIPIYCLITAISAVLVLLHMKFLLAAFIVFSAVLAVAVGDDLRTLPRLPGLMQKMVHACMSVLVFILALWLGLHYRIDLYLRFLDGTWWVVIGALVGFAANQSFVERRKRRR